MPGCMPAGMGGAAPLGCVAAMAIAPTAPSRCCACCRCFPLPQASLQGGAGVSPSRCILLECLSSQNSLADPAWQGQGERELAELAADTLRHGWRLPLAQVGAGQIAAALLGAARVCTAALLPSAFLLSGPA